MTRLVVFLMVRETFNNKSMNSTSKYKLGGFNTWELVPDITDYRLESKVTRKVIISQRELVLGMNIKSCHKQYVV